MVLKGGGKARPQSETGRDWYTKCAGGFTKVYRKLMYHILLEVLRGLFNL